MDAEIGEIGNEKQFTETMSVDRHWEKDHEKNHWHHQQNFLVVYREVQRSREQVDDEKIQQMNCESQNDCGNKIAVESECFSTCGENSSNARLPLRPS